MNLPSLLACVLALGLTGCFRVTIESDSGGYRGSADEKVSVQRGAEGIVAADMREIVVENEFGPVTVTGADSGLGWEWALTCWGKDTAAAETHANRWRMETTTEGSRLRLRLVTDLNGNERRRIESRVSVRVSKTASVEVQNTFGEVQVAGLSGAATLRAQHGKVSLRQVGGAVKASTSFAALEADEIGAAELANQNGAVHALKVAGTLVAHTSFAELVAEAVQGKATLRNQNGAIQATQIGGDLDAETSFTPLQVRGVDGAADLRNQNGAIEARDVTGTLRARTSFAGIELEGASPVFDAQNQNGAISILVRSGTAERIEANTSFAPIEVQLPASAKPVIRAETTFGKIDSDFPVLLWSSVSDSQFAADPGTPKLTLKGQNANITVRKAGGR